jgi:hypothetical protein
MTLRTRAKSWAVLPALGLLTWSAAGCQTQAPTTEPASAAAAAAPAASSVSAPPAETPAPQPVANAVPATPPELTPTIPGLSATDVGPDRNDPLPVRSYVDQEVRRVDAEVTRTGRTLEGTIRREGDAAVDKSLKRAEGEVNKEIDAVSPAR